MPEENKAETLSPEMTGATRSAETARALIRKTKRATRRRFPTEEKIRIVMEGVRGEVSVAELCRREGIHPTIYYKWLKDFMEAGKARMQREFSPDQLAELKELADGKSFPELSHDLLKAVDLDAQAAKAKEIAGGGEPSKEQRKTAVDQLVQEAVTPFMRAKFRRRLLEIRVQNEQTIDRHTIDEILYSGFDATALDKAQAKVKDFRAWIEQNRSELTALQLLYSGTRPLRLKLKDLRDLKDAIASPPLSATPTQLWRAFQATEADKVKGSGGRQLADLVNLVRHALAPDSELAPYRVDLVARYEQWLKERDAQRAFTKEQREWLDHMAEHIATSVSIEPEDFDYGWFGQNGCLSKAHLVFDGQLMPLISELNDRLAL